MKTDVNVPLKSNKQKLRKKNLFSAVSNWGKKRDGSVRQ
jgi:hypothetical protein